MFVAYRQPTIDDVAWLATHLRQADRDEVAASTGLDPAVVIQKGVELSAITMSVLYDGGVMAIFGVVDVSTSVLGGKIGCGWLLTSTLVDKHPKVFLRQCYKILPMLLREYDSLTNYIDARHSRALRWAEGLGFALFEPEPYGHAGLPFRQFIVTKELFDVRASNVGRSGVGRHSARHRRVDVPAAPAGSV